MIDFPCKCGHAFSVEDEQAGASLQCPKCGLLVDVPLLSDLHALDDGGLYKFNESEAPKRAPMPAYEKAYSRARGDADGYDLRPTIQEVKAAGADAEKDSLADGVVSQAPKYDPETGELIKPMDLAAGPAVPVIPINTDSRALNYGRGRPHVERLQITLEAMLAPGNFVVVIIVFGMTFVSRWLMGKWVLEYFAIPFVAAILAHYANVVEDIGAEEQNELPRLLRDLELGHDVFGPLFRMLATLVMCYAPVVWIMGMTDLGALRWLLGIGLFCGGTFLMPAVMLALMTSGSLPNARPDRIFGVITTCGWDYFRAVGWAISTMLLFLWLIFGTEWLASISWGRTSPTGKVIVGWVGLVVASLFATLVAHAFCWYVGLLHRGHHENFPWVNQYHEPTKMRNRTAMINPKRAVSHPNQARNSRV